jgi:hypothetical protein
MLSPATGGCTRLIEQRIITMANKGTYLRTNEYLGTDDYLVAANGLFFAIMQADGNFCVYRGSGPADNRGWLWGSQVTDATTTSFFAIAQADGNFCVYRGTGPADNRGWLWGSQVTATADAFFAIVQDDGNFCVYKGQDPAHNQGYVWGTQATDPVVDVEISSITYDFTNVVRVHDGISTLYRQAVTNQTAQPQTSFITGSEAVTETSGWASSFAVKAGASTTFKGGVPLVGEASVTLSVDLTYTYTWNGSVSRARTWGFNTPVTVPPHSAANCLVAVGTSTISVPYTLTGTFILKSGARIPGSLRGTYTGTNSHDLEVTFIAQNAVTFEIETMTRRISPSEVGDGPAPEPVLVAVPA